ncbi:adenylosuccinate synthase [Patescibacteria group bacterium]|nr:adenylosuccinate synthase [Patescibacteria group bacterium]
MQEFLSSLGQVSAIIGAQWGDEGKGKATDIVSEHFDVIARACGGANAGHTIVVDGKKHIFHLLPSGCLHEGKPVVLGAGMVIHLPTLLEEIETLKEAGVDIVPRLSISDEAHILFDYYKDLDAKLEELREQGIGTTKRGIGPAYMEKAKRSGIRMENLNSDPSDALSAAAKELEKTYGLTIDIASEIARLKEAQEVLKGCVNDTVMQLHGYLKEGKKILIEGAQGTLLDIDHGSYPFVTSSSTTSAGALQGLGIPPNALKSCIGIAKAYCTRVGEGGFATEVEGEVGDRLRERGGEYGATTGRPRRCGWLHIDDLNKAVMLNGITHWNITKLDVLDEEEKIPVGVGYDNGNVVYEQIQGWKASTVGMTKFEELPENAQSYIKYIEDKTGVSVALIGTGQGREEMIVRS